MKKIMQKITLRVDGMHCKSCEMLIEESIEDLGAEKVDASFEQGKVIVVFDESKTSLNQIKHTIEKEGYKVR